MKHQPDPKLQEARSAAISGKKTAALRANPMPIFALGQGHARTLVAEDNITNQQVAMCTAEKLGLSADLVVLGAGAVGAPETPVFDRAALLHRVLNDEDLAREVIEGFLGDLPGQILQLKNYAAAGDARHVEQQAHKIRGASATVGGAALSSLAATMEQAARTGDLVMISTRLAELDTQFEALKAAMNPETFD